MSVPSSNTTRSGDLLQGLRPRDYLAIARRRRWWIVVSWLAVGLMVGVISLRLPNVYRAQTVILVDPQKVPGYYVGRQDSSSIEDRLALIRQEVLAQSRLKKLVDSMGLYSELKSRYTDQEILKRMERSVDVQPVEGGRRLNAFRITFDGNNPVTVAQVVNQLAANFIEANLKDREQQSYGTAEFLDQELEKTKKQLQDKDDELRAVKSRYVMDLPESQQYHMEALNNLRSQLQASQDRVNAAHQQKVYLQSLMATTAPTIDLDSNNSSPYESEIQKLESRLSEVQTRYGPEYPDVRKIRVQLEELKARADKDSKAGPVVTASTPLASGSAARSNPVIGPQLDALDQLIAEQTKQQTRLEEQINFHISKLQQVPLFEQKVAGLMRDYDSIRAYYKSLLDKKLSADTVSSMETRQKGERFVILDPAQIPDKPYGPKRLLIALGGIVVGLLAGVGLAMVAEMADESVRTEREAMGFVGKPVLCAVPELKTRRQERLRRLGWAALVASTSVISVCMGLVAATLLGRFVS